jgi:hypothetical protein
MPSDNSCQRLVKEELRIAGIGYANRLFSRSGDVCGDAGNQVIPGGDIDTAQSMV